MLSNFPVPDDLVVFPVDPPEPTKNPPEANWFCVGILVSKAVQILSTKGLLSG